MNDGEFWIKLWTRLFLAVATVVTLVGLFHCYHLSKVTEIHKYEYRLHFPDGKFKSVSKEIEVGE